MCNNKPLFPGVIFALFFFLTGFAQAGAEPLQIKQGAFARIVVTPGPGASSVAGRLKGRTIPYFEIEKGVFAALVGIDMDQPVGTLPFLTTWKLDGKTVTREHVIDVRAAKFGVQKLTLPKKKVDLDPPTLKRVRREKALMRVAFETSVPEKLWEGAFIAPVKGRRQGTFGRRRIINGQPRRAHTGEDISAPTGTPIVAPNHGRVVLVDDFFFNGVSVVIDHGLGLFSMYFHLSAVDVQVGDVVQTGRQIGRVGKSGRVTGPHLHWGMRLNNAKIDPYTLVGAKLD
ncbi:MAG: M23 family metallopeptidase [Nitrospiria bacterium]